MSSLSKYNLLTPPGKLLLILWSTVLVVRGLYLAITRRNRSGTTEERIARPLLYLEIVSSGVVSVLGFFYWVCRPLTEFVHSQKLGMDKPDHSQDTGPRISTISKSQMPASNTTTEFREQGMSEREKPVALDNHPLITRVISTAAIIATIVHLIRLTIFLLNGRDRLR